MIYWLIRIAIYLFFGFIAVYLIEKMLNKRMAVEWRLLTLLTGPSGFGVSLIVYIIHSAVNKK